MFIQSRSRSVVVALVVVLLSVVAARATNVQKTTQDKVYSKDQAARGQKQFVEVCATCHDPAKVGPGKKPAPPLLGEKFLATWDGRTLGELLDQILNNMPSDGSVVLTEDQTADLVAYILQASGMPDGPTALKYGESSKALVIKK
jgi:S-disulfanyl-L-cysteine oxidoreductase SoxD